MLVKLFFLEKLSIKTVAVETQMILLHVLANICASYI